MCDLPMHIHSQIHTRIHALPAKFTVPPDHPANLLTHTLTPLSLPRRKNKYMLSLQTKQLQGALSLDLAVLARLQARTPHPVFTHPPSNTPPTSSFSFHTCIPYSSACSSICMPVFSRAPLLHPLWHCRYAASNVFTASKSKSSLISISIFSSNKACFIIDLSNTLAVTLHFLLARAKQNNIQYTTVSSRLTSCYLRPSKFGLHIADDCSLSVTGVK